jgi:hypothetical protein
MPISLPKLLDFKAPRRSDQRPQTSLDDELAIRDRAAASAAKPASISTREVARRKAHPDFARILNLVLEPSSLSSEVDAASFS